MSKRNAVVLVDRRLLPGQKVMARNYRCRPAQWERGMVISCRADVQADGFYRIQYGVMLDRRADITITVSDDGITALK